jgi:hypothetical protein
MIADAMKHMIGTPTFADIEAALPEDFLLQQIDLDEMPPMPVDAAFVVAEDGDGDAHVDEPDVSTETVAPKVVTLLDWKPGDVKPRTMASKLNSIEAAEIAVVTAADVLANARNDVNRCQRAERAANGRLSQAILQFQSAFPVYTPAQLIRDHIASEQDQRRRVAAGKIAPPQRIPANSVIDRQRMYARGTGPDDGRGNNSRALDMQGGQRVYPASMRGAVIPKPPSVR